MVREHLAITITSKVENTEQDALVALINMAYRVGFAGIILDTNDQPFNRVNANDVAQMVASGILLVAKFRGRIVGCVKAVPEVNGSNKVGEWGCLAVAVEEQRKGIGSQLIDAAEDALRVAGCKTAQLEFLAPTMRVHEHKKRLRTHYTEKRGYALHTGQFDTSTTTLKEGTVLHDLVAMAADVGFTIYTRALV